MRILMLGNSLTTANDLPNALAKELDAEVVVHARGGARLSEHLNPSTKLGARTQQALVEETWDYVVLQEMSNGPVRFPERFAESARNLCQAICSCGAKPVFYATWAYAPSCPKLEKLGITYEEMHEQLHAAYSAAAKKNTAPFADVGTAFYNNPKRELLFASDGVHPSPIGTELACETLSQAIRGDNSKRNSPEYTVYILRCADESLYTGITTDVLRRFEEHRSGGPKAARYTRTHPVVALEATWQVPDRATASALEYHIKRLSHDEKRALIANPKMIENLNE